MSKKTCTKCGGWKGEWHVCPAPRKPRINPENIAMAEKVMGELMDRNAEITRLRAEVEALRTWRLLLLQGVELQALDEGLWFVAESAPEAYLQQELRKLHDLIETHPQFEPEATVDGPSVPLSAPLGETP